MQTEIKVNTLKKLAGKGQSPWYDNIDRRFIKNGHLKELFDNGILGVTSNPTIFEKAVAGSDEYDREIKELAGQGKNSRQIYDILTVKDVSLAADLLKDTYKSSNHLDGYVSIEVLPEFAHNPEETIKSGREIAAKIARPNIMIKVPGTKEAPEAIRALVREGINVNVTLLFSLEQYEICATAYIEGLKDRLKEGRDIKNIFSVASIFVSRVDTKIDKILEDIGNEELKGKIAVSNAKVIYQSFKKLFGGEEFQGLKTKGANVQRPLWASTSTKNPVYSDVKYVEELIGAQTINTIPPHTIDAFLDHGKTELTVENQLDEAKSYLARLKALGIDIDDICRQTQDAGVKAFQASFDKLILSIEKKMNRLDT
ncbi:MAG: transaldolase [Candidatus Omnitrophota bacterium]|nr:MAG: transaldolase [Candidatus Omnitrophota bacterium]